MIDTLGYVLAYGLRNKRRGLDHPDHLFGVDAIASITRRFGWMRSVWAAIRRRFPPEDLGGRPLGLGRDRRPGRRDC